MNFLHEGLDIVAPSFIQLANVTDLIKMLSKVDTIKGSNVEKASNKWRVTFDHISNWGKDPNPCILGKKMLSLQQIAKVNFTP